MIKPTDYDTQEKYAAALAAAASEKASASAKSKAEKILETAAKKSEKAAEAAKKQAVLAWAAAESNRKLIDLHKQVGFDSTKELIDALRTLIRGKSSKVASTGKRTRTTLTPEIIEKVKKLLAQGKKAPAVAKEIGVSTPTVYNIAKRG